MPALFVPVGLAALCATRVRRVEVTGASMTPALNAGDRLVVLRSRRVVKGDIVAVRDPRQPDRTLVKRVAASDPAGVVVLGDNRAASTDSRSFGPLSLASVRGRAVYRYAPADRAGWLVGRGERIWRRPGRGRLAER